MTRMNKTLYFGNWTVFIWIDDEWFWKWAVPSSANDSTYNSHCFYFGYLNFDVTWSIPDQQRGA